jgi:hypothetical protein
VQTAASRPKLALTDVNPQLVPSQYVSIRRMIRLFSLTYTSDSQLRNGFLNM